MVKKIIKVRAGEYRMVVDQDLYLIQRQTIDFWTTWIADNIINSKAAFKADTKKSLITKILQHHGKAES